MSVTVNTYTPPSPSSHLSIYLYTPPPYIFPSPLNLR